MLFDQLGYLLIYAPDWALWTLIGLIVTVTVGGAVVAVRNAGDQQ